MTNSRWTEADRQLVQSLYSTTSFRDIALSVNRSTESVRKVAQRLGLRGKKPIKKWEPKEIELLRELYPRFHAREVATKLGRSIDCIYNMAAKLSLKRFDSSVKIMSVRMSHGRPNARIRIGGVWVDYHKFIWERHNGNVPRGHVLRFKDGDTLNCTIDNLEMVTRQEHQSRLLNSDNYVAMTMTRTHRGIDSFLYHIVLQDRDLIDAKKNLLELQRALRKECDATHGR